MKQALGILLTLVFLATGSGAAGFLHEADHARHAEHARATVARHASDVALDADADADHHHPGPSSSDEGDRHDCQICLGLHAPISADAASVPALDVAPAFKAAPPTLLSLTGTRTIFRAACRGPPT